jgi:O-antigen/teichoic acid export membrane protein
MVLAVTGNEKDVFFGVGLGVILNIILNWTLIPIYGLEGAAIATFTSLVFWNALLSFRVYSRIGIVPNIVLKLFVRQRFW